MDAGDICTSPSSEPFVHVFDCTTIPGYTALESIFQTSYMIEFRSLFISEASWKGGSSGVKTWLPQRRNPHRSYINHRSHKPRLLQDPSGPLPSALSPPALPHQAHSVAPEHHALQHNPIRRSLLHNTMDPLANPDSRRSIASLEDGIVMDLHLQLRQCYHRLRRSVHRGRLRTPRS
jgi:hypothetical protein